ncbi:DUF4192 family protein [Demequina sp. SYSU T00039]|uniref:DUF4192 family protein n=1 Tax=Demequina lignilytica TaxID=3051663 RepID=A0AAW7M0S3_9MICO|nr:MULTISPECIES: DUF4192 family protein [unclassified Demequina]MDN4486804.1 DUF4192 family protein [Demequina sp. SYSU T00039]MDN4489488.1 DUF4192 family protein [Demequina sp. SYSU T00068]
MTVITGPGELVALVPRMLGFEPADSVVTVLLGDAGAVLAALRVDRRDLLADDGPDLALQVAAQAARDGAARALVLGFTDEPADRRCDALDRVADALADTVGEVGSWRVTAGRYFCPDCTDPRCCPPGGRAVPAARPDPGLDGRWRRAWARDLRSAPAEERRKSVRAARRWEARASALGPAGWRVRSVETWLVALGSDGWNAALLGRIAAGLADVRVRDAALIALVPGADAAVAEARDGRDGEAVAAVLGAGLTPRSAPDPVRSARARELLAGILDHLAGERAAPAAAMLAVLAWWTSDRDGAVAWSEVALELQPGYRLAGLVRALVETSGER